LFTIKYPLINPYKKKANPAQKALIAKELYFLAANYLNKSHYQSKNQQAKNKQKVLINKTVEFRI
jgi:hypothetical protein